MRVEGRYQVVARPRAPVVTVRDVWTVFADGAAHLRMAECGIAGTGTGTGVERAGQLYEIIDIYCYYDIDGDGIGSAGSHFDCLRILSAG